MWKLTTKHPKLNGLRRKNTHPISICTIYSSLRATLCHFTPKFRTASTSRLTLQRLLANLFSVLLHRRRTWKIITIVTRKLQTFVNTCLCRAIGYTLVRCIYKQAASSAFGPDTECTDLGAKMTMDCKLWSPHRYTIERFHKENIWARGENCKNEDLVENYTGLGWILCRPWLSLRFYLYLSIRHTKFTRNWEHVSASPFTSN